MFNSITLLQLLQKERRCPLCNIQLFLEYNCLNTKCPINFTCQSDPYIIGFNFFHYKITVFYDIKSLIYIRTSVFNVQIIDFTHDLFLSSDFTDIGTLTNKINLIRAFQ